MSKRAVAEIAPLTLLPVELTVGVAVLLIARVITGRTEFRRAASLVRSGDWRVAVVPSYGVGMAKSDWFRGPASDPATMDSFERRLSRAAPQQRPQFLRIKATEILDEAEDPGAWRLAASLLRRVIDDYPDAPDRAMAHQELARYHRRLSQWDAALEQYQQAIDSSLPGRSGSTGIEEVDMAEVLVERNAPGDANRALELLASKHLLTHRHFNSTLFRIALCRARAQSRLGLDASAAAGEALRLAAITDPQLSRHPTIGLVEADREVLKELEKYALP